MFKETQNLKIRMEPEVPDDDGVICRERIRPRKMKSQNIVHRLRNREHFGNKTSINHHSFYQCVFPNLTVSAFKSLSEFN